MHKPEAIKIAIIGLGYVGLPLAIEFSKKYKVAGYDINSQRVDELLDGTDSTNEVENKALLKAKNLIFTNNHEDLCKSNVFIVTVPTPVDAHKRPDLKPLLDASEMLGKILKKDDIIIYESTVYPGATEDDCIPVVEKFSGMRLNKDFYAGYSPERINPGDKSRSLKSILKVTSGSNKKTAEFVDSLYSSIINAGTFKASSIRVAEASKVIENVQRDVNIALVNEIFQIFTNMGINTNEVIEAASTKWNFMKLKPGLVGGHCIGIDPYYLLHKSGEKGYIPDLMRTGREINDGMPSYLVNDFIKNLLKDKINPIGLEVSLLGFTFKENCPDIRNTKALVIYRLLIKNGFKVKVFDPIASKNEVYRKFKIKIISDLDLIDGVAFLCTSHDEFLKLNLKERLPYLYDFRSK